MLEIEIQVQGGEPFHVTVWEGQGATLRSQRHGLNLVIVPSVTDRQTGQVSLWVGEVVGQRSDAVMTQPSAAVAAQVGFRQPLAHFPVDVEVMEVRRPTRAEMRAANPRSTSFLKSSTMFFDEITDVEAASCCISCSIGDELCGCAVRTPCGTCCAGCCGGGLAK